MSRKETAGFILCVLFAAAPVAEAKSKYRIEPGPMVISEEEARITADPNSGMEHAVILVEEKEQDDGISILSKTDCHLRAKILSNEGRSLANVEIPLFTKEGSLKEWWGRTLLPGGVVLELPMSALKEQSAVRTGRTREIRVIKAVLPGVVPGAVIDYGYRLRDVSGAGFRRVPLQQPYPIRRFRYRWVPWNGLDIFGPSNSACTLSRAQGLHVTASREKNSFVVTGTDIPPVVLEPMAPPDDEIRGTAIFYYTFYARDTNDFWDVVATEWDRVATLFAKPDSDAESAIRKMGLPPDAALRTKLSLVYDWLGSHVKNIDLESSEEVEALSGHKSDAGLREGLKGVIEKAAGRPWQLDLSFLGMARALGAEAYLVLASDRRDHDWNPSLLALDQFEEGLVVLRSPDDPPGKLTFTDPGSGLPYGEIPFWVSGGKALLTSSKGGREILLAGTESPQNIASTRAEISLDVARSAARIRWSRTGTGQQGLVERRALRQVDPEERTKRLQALCGASGDLEVVRAEAPRIDDANAGFHLECEGDSAQRGDAGDGSGVSLHLTGAWIEEVPALPSTSRVHPIRLPFPRVERTRIEIPAPPGYHAVEPPPPIRVEGGAGLYTFAVTSTGGSYVVERSLTYARSELPREEYDAFRRFLEEVRVSDRTPLVFERIEGEKR